jgi:hypothetical protein
MTTRAASAAPIQRVLRESGIRAPFHSRIEASTVSDHERLLFPCIRRRKHLRDLRGPWRFEAVLGVIAMAAGALLVGTGRASLVRRPGS